MASLDARTLAARFERTVVGFWSLGGRTVQRRHFQEVSHPTAPDHPLGNFVHRVRGDPRAALHELIGADRTPCTAARRRILIETATPPALEATLVVDDWQLECQLQLVLSSTTPIDAPTSPVRPATRDADWQAITDLFRADHLEEDARRGDPPRPASSTQAAVALRRSLGPDVEYLLAHRGERVTGCLAIWVSEEGVGLVEDLFVRPEARGTGVATELLRHAVHRSRRRGAGAIVIGAETDDTPKHLYAKFGFEPAAVLRSYTAPPSLPPRHDGGPAARDTPTT
ncbi:GNAT family N-acetyltransferase [Nitriliruptor alkaliphilus]|uniref:GNAT family N-acetyltransferase n=1 Tax=Nitriliruptor alkaliphilus TaxID=427918 RepID=UPI000698342B|nr:GNAT family N-acetyltransferase [Nitriliruptor alkaliphilus]